MELAILMQNIKDRCKDKGVPPTVACRESGAGHSLISDMNIGKKPTVQRLQKMADYLGCTVSDLLGETPPGQKKEPTTVSGDGPTVDADLARINDLLSRATPETKKAMIALLEQLRGKE